jgi:biopolymer transport protein ExbD
MARKTRDIPEINAGSMADIAFLLLIFFLVTTTMDTDTGLVRMLPPFIEDEIPPDVKVKERNIFVVLANANDYLLVEGEYMQIDDLKDKAKEFIIGNPSNPDDARFPEFEKAIDPEITKYFGPNQMMSKQIVSLQNDRGTSYDLYIQIQDQLAAAYREVRDEVAEQKFGKTYTDLAASNLESDKDKANAVKKLIPQRISEAEPKDVEQAKIAVGSGK